MRPRDKTAAECAEVSRPRVNPLIKAALQAADDKMNQQSEADWRQQMRSNAVSLVNYATAPVGAKKFEGSSLSR